MRTTKVYYSCFLVFQRLKLLTEEVEFYQNKEGLLKHEANVEATKTVEALKIELGDLSQRHEKC